MATQLTPVKISDLFPAPAAGAADFTFADGDTAGNWFYATDRNLIIVENTDASAQTLTITSSADPETKRTGDITAYSLAANDFGQFYVGKKGWADGNGKINLTPSATTVKIAVFQIL